MFRLMAAAAMHLSDLRAVAIMLPHALSVEVAVEFGRAHTEQQVPRSMTFSGRAVLR
jgi:hypothetical protein